MKSLFLPFIFLSLILPIHLNAQMEEAEAIDQIFADWSQPNTPGCALGIFKDGKIAYAKGYGMANMEYDIPNSATSVFRIGSTSKQFTAASIVLLAEKGKLNLNDKLAKFFPDFPEYAEKITVKHLLNHTSGIRDYLMVAYLKGLADDDYYEDKDIMKWMVNQQSLNFQPGEEYLYSNSGYWLLGQIVNQVAEMNMAEFAEKEIFKPLGMTHTHFHNDHTKIVKNRASGYVPAGEDLYKISMTTLNMIGDGGIFTTIEDIKKWDDAFYQSDVLSEDFWKMMTEQAVLNNGEKIEYASGLMIDEYKGLKTISHGGAFVGFRADMIRFPEQKLSIAIFANRGDANPTRMGYQVADILLKDQFKPAEEKKDNSPEKIIEEKPETELTIAQIVGDYEVEPGVIISISLKEDSIHVLQRWNKSTYTITKTTGNTFQIPDEDRFQFIFSQLAEGASQQLTIKNSGRPSVWTRTEIIDMSKLNLDEYSGEFYSSELDVVYRVSATDKNLSLSIGDNDEPIDLNAAKEDSFTYGGGLVRFSRKDGAISGFKLDAGRVKNLVFEKR